MAVDDRDVQLEAIDGWFRASSCEDDNLIHLEFQMGKWQAAYSISVSMEDARRIALAIDEAVHRCVEEDDAFRKEQGEGWERGRARDLGEDDD